MRDPNQLYIRLIQADTDAVKYLPLAKQIAHQVWEAQGSGSKTVNFQPPSADIPSTLRVVVYNYDTYGIAKIWLRYGNPCSGYYMDSGLVDLTSPTVFNQDMLHLGTDTYANPAWGKISGSGFTHGKNPDGTPMLPVDGANCGAFTFTPVSDVTQEGLLEAGNVAKKQMVCSSGFLPSLFSGKARLLAQTILGRQFSLADVALFSGSASTGLKYNIPATATVSAHTFTVQSALTAGTGLYLDSAKKYWLIDISYGVATTATITPLVLDMCGKQALTKVKATNTRAQNAVYESLALATAVPNTAGQFTVPISVTGTQSSTAVPLYYGFSWSWDGSKADIIIHQQATIPGTANPQAGYVYYQASHVSISILRDTAKVLTTGQTESDRWTIAETITREGDWWPDRFNGLQQVWIPDNTSGTPPTSITPFGLCGTWGCHGLDGTASIVCFYDVNDALQIQTISTTTNSTAGVTITSDSGDWYNQHNLMWLASSHVSRLFDGAPTAGAHHGVYRTKTYDMNLGFNGASDNWHNTTNSTVTATIGSAVDGHMSRTTSAAGPLLPGDPAAGVSWHVGTSWSGGTDFGIGDFGWLTSAGGWSSGGLGLTGILSMIFNYYIQNNVGAPTNYQQYLNILNELPTYTAPSYPGPSNGYMTELNVYGGYPPSGNGNINSYVYGLRYSITINSYPDNELNIGGCCYIIPYGDCSMGYIAKMLKTTTTTWATPTTSTGYAIGDIDIADCIGASMVHKLDASLAPAGNDGSLVQHAISSYVPIYTDVNNISSPTGGTNAVSAPAATISLTCVSMTGNITGSLSADSETTVLELYMTGYFGAYGAFKSMQSAVDGSAVGPTFLTGGYSGTPGDVTNKCFIGFA